MSVGNRDRVSNYYSVSGGKIVKSLGKTEPENMTGVTKRVNKNGDTVYEIQSDYIRGIIVGAGIKPPPDEHPDWKEQMEFTIADEETGEKAILNVSFDSAYGRGFLLACEGIKVKEAVEFEPYKYFSKKKGKDMIGLSILQYGKQLPWTMGTKDNPGDVPQLKEVTFKGKKSWDNTAQLKYFKKLYASFGELLVVVEEEQVVPPEADGVDF